MQRQRESTPQDDNEALDAIKQFQNDGICDEDECLLLTSDSSSPGGYTYSPESEYHTSVDRGWYSTGQEPNVSIQALQQQHRVGRAHFASPPPIVQMAAPDSPLDSGVYSAHSSPITSPSSSPGEQQYMSYPPPHSQQYTVTGITSTVSTTELAFSISHEQNMFSTCNSTSLQQQQQQQQQQQHGGTGMGFPPVSVWNQQQHQILPPCFPSMMKQPTPLPPLPHSHPSPPPHSEPSSSHHHLSVEGSDSMSFITAVQPQQDYFPHTSESSETHNIFCAPAPTSLMHQSYGSPHYFPPGGHRHTQSSSLSQRAGGGRRRTGSRPPKPQIEVDDTDIQDIPASSQLWEFTLKVLEKPRYHYMVSWDNKKEGLFRFHDAPAFAALWGKHRNRPNMTYDKVARALRYYYKRDILKQVGGRLTYRFSSSLVRNFTDTTN